jgi:bacterial/archaeal transporter family protein
MTMLSWVIPAAAFVVVLGLLGVTTKLALRHVTWPVIILWTAIAYAVLSAGLVIGGTGLVFNEGTGFAILSGGMAVSSLVLLYFALGIGDASRVVPVTAAYPAVTVFAAAILIDEPLTIARIGGTALVVAGVVLISTEARQVVEDEGA